MFNITHHYGNRNKNYEIPPHAHQAGYHPKQNKKERSVNKDVLKLDCLCTAGGNVR